MFKVLIRLLRNMNKPAVIRSGAHLLPSVPLPVPYGAHVVTTGVQFSVVSRHATRVWLLLFTHPDDAVPRMEFELTPERNRVGDIWHIHIRDARPGDYYVYRMEGAPPKGHRNYFDPDQWLLDPYAQAVAASPAWGGTEGLEPGRPLRNGAAFPKAVIVRDDFDWSGDVTPKVPMDRTVIYEMHVRGFTAHPNAGVKHPGTFRGLIEKIPHLKRLGVTAVELLPIQEFNEMEFHLENCARRDLRNFWGYSTMAFFAPNGRYSASGVRGQQVKEFKELVMALHQAGIEVILDVVFNHSAEAGDEGPTYSFRGIDNSVYYLMDETGRHYANFSGCGNTLNSNHPVVRDFVLSCLRYWALHMHVDGFRFDLASVLARGPDGKLLVDPPLIDHIAEDPALRHTKLIAEAWDAAGTYHVGSFPSARWSEWNGRYRDDVRRFWRGDSGLLSALATRLCGSSDLYAKDGRGPLKSVNFVTSHDGFTLADLVSYEQKHNEANGENNRDGDNHNFSCNHGAEGPTRDSAILALRERQQRNFLATLLLSQGVPMLTAGDEFGRSQQGNNNAYCQDNEISWIDWSLPEKNATLQDFVRDLIALRRQHPALRRATFLTGAQNGAKTADIVWFGPEGRPPDWDHGQTIGCLLRGDRAFTGADEDSAHLAIVFNAQKEAARYELPEAPARPWRLTLSSQQPGPSLAGRTLTAGDRSVTVLVSDIT